MTIIYDFMYASANMASYEIVCTMAYMQVLMVAALSLQQPLSPLIVAVFLAYIVHFWLSHTNCNRIAMANDF